jgi:hypothetical protein
MKGGDKKVKMTNREQHVMCSEVICNTKEINHLTIAMLMNLKSLV